LIITLNRFFCLMMNVAFVHQAEGRVEYEMTKAAEYAARVAKRDRKPKRTRACIEDDHMSSRSIHVPSCLA